jgi:hypothetical protein
MHYPKMPEEDGATYADWKAPIERELEITALPSIKEAYWIAAVQEADALLVNGGDVWQAMNNRISGRSSASSTRCASSAM